MFQVHRKEAWREAKQLKFPASSLLPPPGEILYWHRNNSSFSVATHSALLCQTLCYENSNRQDAGSANTFKEETRKEKSKFTCHTISVQQ